MSFIATQHSFTISVRVFAARVSLFSLFCYFREGLFSNSDLWHVYNSFSVLMTAQGFCTITSVSIQSCLLVAYFSQFSKQPMFYMQSFFFIFILYFLEG